MALRGFSGFGDQPTQQELEPYADWWSQTGGQALTEVVRPEILQAEARQAAAAASAAMPSVSVQKVPAKPATARAVPSLGSRIFTPLLVIGGLGLVVMLFASGKKK